MYPNNTFEIFRYLPKLSLIFLTILSIIWLVWRFQSISRVFISKISKNIGEQSKLTTTPQDLKQIEKVHKIMDKKKTEKSEDKPRAIGRLAGSMLFVVFGLLAMSFIIVMNESFNGLEEIHVFTMLTFSVVMIICAIIIFFVIYLENELELEEKNQTRLRNIIDSTNDQRYIELLEEIRTINRHDDEVDRFLNDQYGKLYDLVE